ncbi:hypothetical protein J2X03_000695 [Microbacterium trichothecenolyticum]|uniref:glycosyltransferase family 1 protein n=1 Tax=Microbacterium trichothecenolyticum TaxID=69370 RepID=UPI0028582413|nr:glycosyltransferase family 1 protein [Microbacterium trichothecenolyticum]MDR7110839.1 hypothetical protein [Microbacterium trichothecenolyticum]
MVASRKLTAQVRRAWEVGPRGVAQRLAQRAYQATGAAELRLNLALEDHLTDAPCSLPVPQERPEPGTPLAVGWVCTPPTPGSGGHTTLLRMVAGLEARGHSCVLYLYDKDGLDVRAATHLLRTHWPEVGAVVRDVSDGIAGVDAVVATGWESAHLIVKQAADPLRRLYFIQDYEPYFYGRGAEYEFAAMTYRMPFRRIALGEMLDGIIQAETGLHSDVVPFGCDSAAYGPPVPPVERRGVVFYCRPDFPRRGYQLAALTLIEFHRLHPDQPIHVYGAPPRGLDVPHTFHGRLSPAQLNELYGRTVAGLAMSFTNMTLVAEEMMAAGNIPVVNDIDLARLVLPNAGVRWAAPTAGALARQLGEAVSAPDIEQRAAAAAASVTGRSWQPTYDAVVRIIEEEVYGT